MAKIRLTVLEGSVDRRVYVWVTDWLIVLVIVSEL